MNINEMAVGHEDGIGLSGDRCISQIPRQVRHDLSGLLPKRFPFHLMRVANISMNVTALTLTNTSMHIPEHIYNA